MNLRDELYPIHTTYEFDNDVISNDNTDVWIVPTYKLERFIEYIKTICQRFNYKHIEYLINSKEHKDIIIALPRCDCNTVGYCTAHPNNCSYNRYHGIYMCNECIKLRDYK